MDELILRLLRADLNIQTDKRDEYLKTLVRGARDLISREGICLQDTYEDAMLTEMYAAYLYLKRKENVAMPQMLRWALNNRILGEKNDD